MTLWFHPACAAHKRPEPFLEGLAETEAEVESRDRLEAVAQIGKAQRRLPRLNGAQTAPTARARCRSCRERIDKGAWRIPLVFYEEGRFEPSGFIHVSCTKAYFETADILERMQHFSPELTPENVAELAELLAALD